MVIEFINDMVKNIAVRQGTLILRDRRYVQCCAQQCLGRGCSKI